MSWPQLVIFDCDGVLVDSEMIALGQTRLALGKLGLHLTHAQTQERYLGLRMDTVLLKAEAELGAALSPEFRHQLSSAILEQLEREMTGIAGVRTALAGLRAQVCVASSSSPERIRRSLALAKYDGLFEPNVFSASMVARGKPHPDLFAFAAHQMSMAAKDCLVIEDSVPGITGAIAAGMTVFGFAGGSHFCEPSQRGQLTEAGAHLIFDDMSLLPQIIAQHLALMQRGARLQSVGT